MNLKNLKKQDPKIYKSIMAEAKRQKEGLEMIPSENYVSQAVLEAMGSILTNKYSEGLPKKRYYGGNEFIDEVEVLAQERAKKLFGVPYANVQPYSGSPANQAVTMAVLKPTETLMGLNLQDGGHLTHGANLSFSSIYYKSVSYHVKQNGKVDFDEVKKLVLEHKPKLIWVGGSAYTKQYEYKEFAEIAKLVDACLVADIAHVAGLIVGGVHTNPVPYAHAITTTTHKTLRGPRGAMILVTEIGLKKDPELSAKIDKAVFPGLQGGPHNHTTAAIAVALQEASSPKFKKYAEAIVKNSKALSDSLMSEGLKLVGNGTENHLVLIDLVESNGKGSGNLIEYALEVAGITVNKNTIPADPSTPYYPSGIRCGTPALTSRGMREKEMKQIGKWISQVCKEVGGRKMPDTKEERIEYIKTYKAKIKVNKNILEIKKEVKAMCLKFPVRGISD